MARFSTLRAICHIGSLILVMYKPADAAQMILSMCRAAYRKDDLLTFGVLWRSLNLMRSSVIYETNTHMDTVRCNIGCEPANFSFSSFFVLSKVIYFVHSNNDSLVTVRANSMIPCILYTHSKLFGIIFSFNFGPRQYTSECRRYHRGQ